jgi:hypothetical protein
MPHHAPNSPPPDVGISCDDEEYLLSGDEAALAAALALMTGFGHGCCAAHRGPMAARVAEALGSLAHAMQGPSLSPGMQTLLLRLRARWAALAAHAQHSRAQEPATPLTPDVLWHAPLETLQ